MFTDLQERMMDRIEKFINQQEKNDNALVDRIFGQFDSLKSTSNHFSQPTISSSLNLFDPPLRSEESCEIGDPPVLTESHINLNSPSSQVSEESVYEIVDILEDDLFQNLTQEEESN